MINKNIIEKFAVIIPSCDKYSDLWEPFFNLFWKNWEDCPFKVYLLSNNLAYTHSKVFPILIGEDVTWSMNIKKSLLQIEEDYIFLLLEDHFIIEQVNTKDILSLASKMYSSGYNYLRFNSYLKPDIEIDSNHGKISRNSPYRTSTPFSLWRKDLLLKLLDDEETAWDFEISGSDRSSQYDNFFSVNRNNYFKSIHGVKKGKWYRNSFKQIKKMGISVDVKNRNVMGRLEYIKNRIVDYAHLILIKFFPIKTKTIILNKIYKKR